MNLAPLADATRQRIVEMLAQHELSSGEIASRFEISAPAVSQHLAVLKNAGLVRCRVEGQRRIYELEPSGFATIERWLSGIMRFWGLRLDRLETELRKPSPKTKTKRSKP